MARRRNTKGGSLDTLLAVILFGGFALGLAVEAPEVMVALFALTVLTCIVYLLAKFDAFTGWEINSAIRRGVSEHEEALMRRYAQTVYVDDYGKAVLEGWRKELRYFARQVVAPTVGENARQVLLYNVEHWMLRNQAVLKLQSRASQIAPITGFYPLMAGTDFERYCAEQLRRLGWKTRLTKASGDQGADVIAEKDGVRVVLQCKRYSQPVGNKAVQEAHAARNYERTQFAAVVTNASYTPAARQLAQTTGVLLLHVSDLEHLHESLPAN